MHFAVALRLSDPSLPLTEALLASGFAFPSLSGGSGMAVVDTDGIPMKQRKNQLTRRVRLARQAMERGDRVNLGDVDPKEVARVLKRVQQHVAGTRREHRCRKNRRWRGTILSSSMTARPDASAANGVFGLSDQNDSCPSQTDDSQTQGLVDAEVEENAPLNYRSSWTQNLADGIRILPRMLSFIGGSQSSLSCEDARGTLAPSDGQDSTDILRKRSRASHDMSAQVFQQDSSDQRSNLVPIDDGPQSFHHNMKRLKNDEGNVVIHQVSAHWRMCFDESDELHPKQEKDPYSSRQYNQKLEHQMEPDSLLARAKSSSGPMGKKELEGSSPSSLDGAAGTSTWEPIMLKSATVTSGASDPDGDLTSPEVPLSDTGTSKDTREFILTTFDELVGDEFTEEEAMREAAQQTEQERAATIADLTGRSLRSFAPKPMDDLVKEMQFELSQRSVYCKKALMKAQKICHQKEFSDERLELFLHRDDMDVKQAADRFVKYWEKRLEYFGPDKFHLPMSLDGALRDDSAALRTGAWKFLPRPDASGRRILQYTSSLNTMEGYTRDSMIRAMWYMFEATLEYPEARRGVVLLAWSKNLTLWNIDRKLTLAMFELENEVFPLKLRAIHSCRPPSVLLHFFKPIVLAILGKRFRPRWLVHMEEGSELANVLQGFGIDKDTLSSEMGGTLNFNHNIWLNERQAAGK